MSQHIIVNPNTKKQEQVEVFRSGGRAVAILFSTHHEEDIKQVNRLLGLEETHRQRIANKEMPARDM